MNKTTSRVAPVVGVCGVLIAVISGCARAPVAPTAPAMPAQDLLMKACEPGKSVTAAKGTVWIRAKSKDASGQFPGTVQVKSPDSLRMEVTNPLGGTEAIINVDGKTYTIQVPKHPERSQKGNYAWAGIPLRWAPDLFLGRIPCPSPESLKGATLAVSKAGELTVDVPGSVEQDAQKFFYRFRDRDGQPWPEFLRWERKGALASVVEFKFDDPEKETGSPLKWDAQSPQGDVKVRWRDREMPH